jgi:hypothetical protein
LLLFDSGNLLLFKESSVLAPASLFLSGTSILVHVLVLEIGRAYGLRCRVVIFDFNDRSVLLAGSLAARGWRGLLRLLKTLLVLGGGCCGLEAWRSSLVNPREADVSDAYAEFEISPFMGMSEEERHTGLRIEKLHRSHELNSDKKRSQTFLHFLQSSH